MFSRLLFHFLFFGIFWIGTSALFGQDSDSSLQPTPVPEEGSLLAEFCSYTEDRDRSYSLEQILQTSYPGYREFDFLPLTSRVPGFGYSTSAFWLRCEISNTDSKPASYIIEIDNPQLDEIRFYSPGPKGNLEEIRIGDLYPFSQRPILYRSFLVPVEISAGRSNIYYIRVISSGSLTLPMRIWTQQGLLSKIGIDQLIIGLFIGIAAVMILYNLFMFGFIRELHYLYYVLFLFGWLFAMLALFGVSFQFFWPESPWWANYNFPVFLFFASTWGLLFTRSILNLKNYNIYLDRLVYYLVYINAAAISIPFLLDYHYTIRLALSLIFAEVFLVFGIAIYLFVKDRKPSEYFLIAWAGFTLGILYFQCQSMGWISPNSWARWSIQLGASFEVILLSLALADRINMIRREKEEAQDEVIRMQKIAIENIKTSQKQQEQIIALNQELRIAGEIHQAILPQTIPKPAGAKISVCYIPMAEIGGDLYEFVLSPDEKSMGVFVADVAGHGIPAAQVSSIMKAIFTFHKKHANKPDKLLREMNQTLLAMHNNQMVTAGYLYFDFKTKQALYANSAHPPLLVWKKQKAVVESFFPEGRILGWMEDSGNKSISIPFQKGDKFFLFSDGITETRRNGTEVWGEENFMRFITDHATLPTEDFITELLQTLKNYSMNEEGFEDDITLLVIELE